jgi:hypothetical protein
MQVFWRVKQIDASIGATLGLDGKIKMSSDAEQRFDPDIATRS